jgi:hypothetical protein
MMPYNPERSKLWGVKSREGTKMLRVSRERPTKTRQTGFWTTKAPSIKVVPPTTCPDIQVMY